MHGLPGRSATLGLLALAALTATSRALAGASAPRPAAPPVALVEIDIASPAARAALVDLQLDVVALRPGLAARVLAWPGDAEAMQRAGLATRVLDADVGRSAARAAGAAPPAAAAAPTAVVPPFASGALAGFYNRAEIEQYLTDIAAADAAGIVSNAVQIGTSQQGRPIFAVRIADESQPDHSRPRVLFTALTHAREPGGMQAVIYFMNALLQGYGTDPDLTYLVDNREIWFVPCVNPDGYQINENTWIGSGSFGFWRKNARDNNADGTLGSNEGVDLNRNFGFQWAFDNSGSSPTSGTQTYRGPSAFSEPETQALRDFCNAHGFTTANNYHTAFEATLYPWSYSGSVSPDDAFFVRVADAMLRDAQYAYGIAEDLLYPVNGDANDWMYGEQTTKPKVYALTTEVGNHNDDFWPPAARIVPLSHRQLRSNIVLAYAAGTWVHADGATLVSDDGWLHPNGAAEVALTLRNDGAAASVGAVTVVATTDAPGITITDASTSFAPVGAAATAAPAGLDRLGLSADASVPAGTVVPLYLEIRDAGAFVFHDTTTVTVGQPIVVFDDPAANLANWTVAPAGTWGTQNIGGDLWFSDSPGGSYAGGTDRRLTLGAPLDLSGGAAAFLQFETEWWIEGGYDFARVEASTDGVTWIALAGRNTRAGHGMLGDYSGGTQPDGVPGYDMTQRFPITEVVDLSAYAGRNDVRLRFRLTSDFGAEYDGWHVDDVRVLVYPDDVTDAGPSAGPVDAIALAGASRNPFRDATTLRATFAGPTAFRAAVYAVDGRCVRVLAAGMAAAGTRDLVWDGRSADGRAVAAGTYLVRIESTAGNRSQRVVLLH
jgi:hypothetical protein